MPRNPFPALDGMSEPCRNWEQPQLCFTEGLACPAFLALRIGGRKSFQRLSLE